jgi:hypothetical protein
MAEKTFDRWTKMEKVVDQEWIHLTSLRRWNLPGILFSLNLLCFQRRRRWGFLDGWMHTGTERGCACWRFYRRTWRMPRRHPRREKPMSSIMSRSPSPPQPLWSWTHPGQRCRRSNKVRQQIKRPVSISWPCSRPEPKITACVMAWNFGWTDSLVEVLIKHVYNEVGIRFGL